MFEPLRNQFISIIVPVFNEGKTIETNLNVLLAEVQPYFGRYEIILVNDGSTDQTRQILDRIKIPSLRVIQLEKNRGKGFAVREGLKSAQGDYILYIDGGMELHPKDIRVFLGLLMLYDADLVIGSKRHPQSNVHYPWFRVLLSLLFQAWIRRQFHLDVTDTQVGIKLFKRAVIQSILPHLTIDRYGFDLEILALAQHFGHTKMLEAPVRLDYFGKNSRNIILELGHVFKIGLYILRDTLQVIQNIKGFSK